MPVKPNANHYDGVAKGASILLEIIDDYMKDNNGKLPDFKFMREMLQEKTIASVWSYLYRLESEGHISLVSTPRGLEIFDRHNGEIIANEA